MKDSSQNGSADATTVSGDRSGESTKRVPTESPTIPSTEIPAIAELKRLDQWVGWRRESGKKVPKQATGGNASTSDSRTWSSLDIVTEAAQQYGLTGIGFVFTEGDPYVGIDFDHVLGDDGTIIDPVVERRVKYLNSYTEISPSGNGLHVLLRGRVEKAHRISSESIEIYDRGRYFTITGQHHAGTPRTIEHRQPQLDAIVAEMLNLKVDFSLSRNLIEEGSRHNTIVLRARRFAGKGLSEKEVRGALSAANQHLCHPPLPDAEVTSIADWAIATGTDPSISKCGTGFLSVEELTASCALGIPYWIKGLIESSSVGFVYGKFGIGKTFFVLEAAACVATVRDFLGFATRLGQVFISCGEGGTGISRRVEALLHCDRLSHNNFFVRPYASDLREGRNVQKFIDEIRSVADPDVPVGLIIIDTSRRHMGAGDENAGRDTAALFEAACTIRASFPGASVIIVAHEGYSSRHIRGHSNQQSDADFVIRISGRRPNSRKDWKLEKSRDGSPQAGSFSLRPVVIGMDEEDEPITSMVVDIAESAPEPDGRPLSGRAVRVFEGLHKILDAPSGAEARAQGVSRRELGDWMRHNFPGSDGARRSALSVGLKSLKNQGLVEMRNGLVHITEEAAHATRPKRSDTD